MDTASYTKDAGGIPSLEKLFTMNEKGGFVFDSTTNRLIFSERISKKFIDIEKGLKEYAEFDSLKEKNHAFAQGMHYYDQHQSQVAIESFNIALKDKKNTPSQKFEILAQLGFAYNQKGDYQNAVHAFDQAEQIDKKHQLSINKTDVYFLNKGAAHGALNQFDQELAAYNKALTLANGRQNGDYILFLCFNNLGAFYFSQKNYQKALDYYFQALENTPQHKHTEITVGHVYYQLGETYFNLNNQKKAREFYDKAVVEMPELFGSVYGYYSNIPDR